MASGLGEAGCTGRAGSIKWLGSRAQKKCLSNQKISIRVSVLDVGEAPGKRPLPAADTGRTSSSRTISLQELDRMEFFVYETGETIKADAATGRRHHLEQREGAAGRVPAPLLLPDKFDRAFACVLSRALEDLHESAREL